MTNLLLVLLIIVVAAAGGFLGELLEVAGWVILILIAMGAIGGFPGVAGVAFVSRRTPAVTGVAVRHRVAILPSGHATATDV